MALYKRSETLIAGLLIKAPRFFSRSSKSMSDRFGSETELRSVRKQMQPTAEALQMVSDLRRAKPSQFEALLKARCGRMLRFDYITVIQTLQMEDQVDLSLKVFDMMRKEVWYKTSIQLYELLMILALRHQRMDDWKRLLKNLQDEGGEPVLVMFTIPFRQCIKQGDFDGGMRFYRTVKEFKCKIKAAFLLDSLNQLNQAKQLGLAEEVLQDIAAVEEEV